MLWLLCYSGNPPEDRGREGRSWLSGPFWSCRLAAAFLLGVHNLPLTSSDLECLSSELPWSGILLLLTQPVHFTLWSTGKCPLLLEPSSLLLGHMGVWEIIRLSHKQTSRDTSVSTILQALQWPSGNSYSRVA